jgi:hypothetical protein
MAAERERPSSSPAPAPARDGGDERYGPLLLARHAKDDGRALILYTLKPQEDEERA